MKYYSREHVSEYLKCKVPMQESLKDDDSISYHEEIIILALKKEGIDLSDAEKLKASCQYWLDNGELKWEDYIFEENIEELYYSANDIATYINFLETIGQILDGIDDDDLTKIVIQELKDIGIDVSDEEKLNDSCQYWLLDECIVLDDYPGYCLEYQNADKWNDPV